MPMISVVIPAYNAVRTVAETLRSLDGQTFRDFETVVVDDGSSDGTAAAVEREFPHVRILRQANGGPAAARNLGARQAEGRWLAFLDADDTWLPWRLACQMQLAAEHPQVAMWCGETRPLTPAIGSVDLSRAQASAGEKDAPKGAPGGQTPPPWRELPLGAFTCFNPVSTSTVLLRREVFAKVGGFDVQFRGPEDYDLWLRIAACETIGMIAFPLGYYREDTGSLSMDERRFLPEVLRVLQKAYGRDGALHGRGRMRKAVAVQYVHASWMAYRRGARGTALKWLLASYGQWPAPLPKPRWKYLARYVMGR